jgi:hypothetical protein
VLPFGITKMSFLDLTNVGLVFLESCLLWIIETFDSLRAYRCLGPLGIFREEFISIKAFIMPDFIFLRSCVVIGGLSNNFFW